MKRASLYFATVLFICGWIIEGEGTLVKIIPPNSVINSPQSVDVVIVGSKGNVSRQTAYYQPMNGGIDIDTREAGPNASIYIPVWKTGYIWVGGNWVDETGAYWNGTTKSDSAIPDWNEYWVSYWRPYWNDKRGYWPPNQTYRFEVLNKYRHHRYLRNQQMENTGIKGLGQTNQIPTTHAH